MTIMAPTDITKYRRLFQVPYYPGPRESPSLAGDLSHSVIVPAFHPCSGVWLRKYTSPDRTRPRCASLTQRSASLQPERGYAPDPEQDAGTPPDLNMCVTSAPASAASWQPQALDLSKIRTRLNGRRALRGQPPALDLSKIGSGEFPRVCFLGHF